MKYGGESTLDLCYASSEEIPELQHARRATGNRRNLQCGDDSIWRANVTQDKGSPCLGAVGEPRSGGSALLVVGSSVLVSILLCSLSMSGAALSIMGALRFRGSCSWLASARGHEWLATCVPVQDVLSQGILSSSTTCGISGCLEIENLEYRSVFWLVIIFLIIIDARRPWIGIRVTAP